MAAQSHSTGTTTRLPCIKMTWGIPTNAQKLVTFEKHWTDCTDMTVYVPSTAQASPDLHIFPAF